MISTQEKINRIKQAHELLEDLSYRFDKELNINSCDSENYSHFHRDTYPEGVQISMSHSLELLEDWLSDLQKDLHDEIKEAI